MKISVVISTYNGEKYIKKQLDSIYMQKRQADEVIICDDGSSDQTVSIILNYIEKKRLAPNWNLIVNKENKGWRKNFMDMSWNSTGDIIFFCDQDDIWCIDKLRIMEEIMQKNDKIDVLVSNYTEFYENGKTKTGPYRNDNKLVKIKLKDNFLNVPFPGCTYCVRRRLIEISKNFWQKEFAHDDFFWRLGLFTDSLYAYKDSLIHWRKHKDSTYSLESIGLKNSCEKLKWLDMTENFDTMLLLFCKAKKVDNYDTKVGLIDKNKMWINLRKSFYKTKNIRYGMKLLCYLNSYQRYRQYLGDFYLIYIKDR